ncbi:MAG: hypothetical protein H7288_20620 [Kineosporiaceae bacterium]|nr:hypothetical protein [Aeromicrobium sp.]
MASISDGASTGAKAFLLIQDVPTAVGMASVVSGILISNNSHPLLHSNTISNNIADQSGGGIFVSNNSAPAIVDNVIST